MPALLAAESVVTPVISLLVHGTHKSEDDPEHPTTFPAVHHSIWNAAQPTTVVFLGLKLDTGKGIWTEESTVGMAHQNPPRIMEEP